MNPITRTLRALLTVGALLVGAIITTTPAQAATCTTVWLTTPSYEHVVNTGAKRCLDLTEKSNGWIRVYQFDDKSRPAVDFINEGKITRSAPNSGRYQANADRARAFAAKWGVAIRFSDADIFGRTGCRGDYAGAISGSYTSSPSYPGEGLIQLGTGPTSTCMRDRLEVMETVKHEVAHERIETRCGTIRPAIAGTRWEQVTDAYAYLGLDAETRKPGGYGFTEADMDKARLIAKNICTAAQARGR